MVLSREFEESCAEQYTKGHITGFLHLYSGQEAVAVGATAGLHKDDYILSAYREHAQAIVRGADPRRVMAELFGKATGICKGKGGSMHLFDPALNFMGGYAIVGGQFPIAVGLAFSAKYRSAAEHDVWKSRDPIPALAKRLVAEEIASDSQLAEIRTKCLAVVQEAVKFAEESPWPEESEVYNDIYV
jgi:TPP-dependent pyruvate/acetoin dehydrogenase alpha subunit